MAALEVPHTLAEALEPDWLNRALRPVCGGAAITTVETVEVIRTVATKVRFKVHCAGVPGGTLALCLKGLLDVDAQTARGGPVTVLEANFYDELAPKLSVRIPDCVTTVIDRETQFAVVIMRDLIADGAQFCTALEPFSAEEAAQSLEQIARLHADRTLLAETPWVNQRVAKLAEAQYVSPKQLQELLNGPRGEGLPARTRNAALLIQALRKLAERDAAGPHVLVHGDAHAGNIFRTAEGPGLIDWQLLQCGGWALDVAYHIAAVLPVDLAEAEERRLLAHYIDTVRGLGGEAPDLDEAWEQYRAAAVYGFYLWSITRRVDPEIINLFVQRLGAAVTRHKSYDLLGV